MEAKSGEQLATQRTATHCKALQYTLQHTLQQTLQRTHTWRATTTEAGHGLYGVATISRLL